MQDVAASPEWLALDKSAVQEVLSRATLRVASEDLVLEALKAWSSNMETSRREAYVELFCDPVAGIRLPYVGKETLVNLDKEEKALLEAEGGQGQTNLSKLVHEELVRRVMNDPTSVQPRVYVDDAGNVAMQDAEDAKSDPKLKAAKKKYVGKKITKMFNGTAYNGSILSVGREQNTNRLLFSIKYEDGDLEDVYQKEADEMMKPKAPPAKAAKKTPGKKTPAK